MHDVDELILEQSKGNTTCTVSGNEFCRRFCGKVCEKACATFNDGERKVLIEKIKAKHKV